MQPTYLYAISPASQVACFSTDLFLLIELIWSRLLCLQSCARRDWRVWLAGVLGGGFYRTTAVPVAIAASMALSAPAVK